MWMKWLQILNDTKGNILNILRSSQRFLEAVMFLLLFLNRTVIAKTYVTSPLSLSVISLQKEPRLTLFFLYQSHIFP